MTTINVVEATSTEALKFLEDNFAQFLKLQFTDIMGTNKNIEVPQAQFEKAINGEIMFDGSSIEGFVRIEESDMLLKPDLDTLALDPSRNSVARVICDIYHTDGTPFAGCPRLILKKVIAEAEALGYEAAFGCEAEFFVFNKNGKKTDDSAGYFDAAPADKGESLRQSIIYQLHELEFEVEASHHEVAAGQHEIDFKYADPLKTADNLATFKIIVRRQCNEYGLMASFMPKPVNGINGSGMHTHQSLFTKNVNQFDDPNGEHGLSDTALSYIAGLMEHAKGMCAITNPTVNSYKRLVPGYEAPTIIAWSPMNRSPLIRIPAKRGDSTRCELRMPDPSANPYLAIAVQLAAGLDGIKRKLTPPPVTTENLFDESALRSHHLESLPRDLHDALDHLENSPLILDVLGAHISSKFVEAKRREWLEYSAFVSKWETDRYLGKI